MVDVVSRRCEQAGCRRRPLYGYEVRERSWVLCFYAASAGDRAACRYVGLSLSFLSAAATLHLVAKADRGVAPT